MACQEIREIDAEASYGLGAVLIKCSQEKCHREFHVDCAFNQGGISLDEESGGILTFLCDLHFKDVLFCTCKRKYDDTQSMVFCDECCDWFHTTCEGIKQRDAQKLDQQERFVCHSCRSIALDGKKVSAALRERNMNKDFQSGCQQAAQKSVGQLIDLASSVGPVVDDISIPTPFDQSEYSVKDIRSAWEFLTSSAVLGTTSTDAEDRNFLDFTGTRGYVQMAADKISLYLKRLDAWFVRAQQVCGTDANAFSAASMDKKNCMIAESLRSKVEVLLTELKTSIRYEPSEIDSFFAFAEMITWVCDFQRVLLNHQFPF